jgi:putative ubiquitin-RnfH superfamily antitoxin RatB of RatAB toxin-antitoxin module
MFSKSVLVKYTVEVVYLSSSQHCFSISLKVSQGATIEYAIMASGVCEVCPEIDLAKNNVGVFGCVLPLSHVLLDGDRVEIYRPLEVDPKEARRIMARTPLS